VEVVGEPHLLHHLALLGFLKSESHLYTSTVDVGKIRAVARNHSGPWTQMEVDQQGAIALPPTFASDSVISLQVENGETGIAQDLNLGRDTSSAIALDATRTIPRSELLDGASVATFDAQSWNGPSGLGFLVINDGDKYRYPFAHIAPIRTPGSYSLPLLVGAVIALNEARSTISTQYQLRRTLAQGLTGVPGVTVIGSAQSESRYLSAIVDGISGEEVLRSLLGQDIAADAGSACSPEDLAPSHVIASMGYPTTGHLRFTIHPTTQAADINTLLNGLKEVITKLRS
jgi:cysteine desulfurase